MVDQARLAGTGAAITYFNPEAQMSVLLIVAHPNLEESKFNKRLLQEAEKLGGITIHDLYASSPDGNIDVAAEQARLLDHDTIIFQHPMYWYSVPTLVKKWQEDVLISGWAYGTEKKLKGKKIHHVFTTGGAKDSYQAGGHSQFTYDEYLRPLQGLIHWIGAEFIPYFIVDNTHRMTDDELENQADGYRLHLQQLVHA